MSTTHISLEPPAITAQDGLDDDLFVPPARLYEITHDGQQVLTRQVGVRRRAHGGERVQLIRAGLGFGCGFFVFVFDREDPNKAPTERLLRIWQERGDFSRLTSQSIRDEQDKETAPTNEHDEAQDEDLDDVHELGMTPEQMRQLQMTMMQQLDLARGELTTALDLLSIIAAPTVATTVDAEALPLPQQTLTIVPSAPRVPLPSSENDDSPTEHTAASTSLLPLATSLSSLRESANSFFSASNQVLASTSNSTASTSTSTPSCNPTSEQWSTLLHLHTSTPFPLIPLGAQPNASFSGQGEPRLAKQVGIFYGCAEAAPAFRRVGVAQVEHVLQEVQEGREGKGRGTGKRRGRGRKLVVEVEMDGKGKDWCVWSSGGGDKEEKDLDVDEVLRQRGRNVFAEELFTVLSNEARSDASVKSRLELGKRSQGDSVITEGHGWKLKITMVAVPNPQLEAPTPEPNAIAPLLVPLLRLLLIQEYARRRSPSSSSASIPVLPTLSALLSHLYRLNSLSQVLPTLTTTIDPSIPTSTTYHPSLASAPLQAIRKILFPPTSATELKELGGRIVLRIGSLQTSLFHISHSTLLPQPSSTSTTSSSSNPSPSIGLSAFALASHQGLVLHAPRSAPVVVGSVGQLKGFLKEQMGEVLKGYTGGRKGEVEVGKGPDKEGMEVDQSG